MSQHVETHAIDRVTNELAIGHVARLERHRAHWAGDELTEEEVQKPIAVSGIARNMIAWTKVYVMFDHIFIFSPEQRDSPLPYPHFTFGPVVSGVPSPDGVGADPDNPDCLVSIDCHVKEWVRDLGIDGYIGALVGVGVSTSGNVDIRFDGHVHLRFQGWGCPNDALGSVEG